MRKVPINSGMWAYLNELGILENGSDAQITIAKKAFRKEYFVNYKRNYRTKNSAFTINFSNENSDYQRIKQAAKSHKMTITGFIRASVLAYLNQSFILPDRDTVARLEQTLSQCLNEIQSIVRPKEKYSWERERKFELIEKRIEKLEAEINQIFRNPPLCKHDH